MQIIYGICALSQNKLKLCRLINMEAQFHTSLSNNLDACKCPKKYRYAFAAKNLACSDVR